MKNKKPLTPKQRERLAREARRTNAAKAAAAAAVKTPVPRETKWFFGLLAAVLVFATLASVLFGFWLVDVTNDPTLTVYESLRIRDYLDTRNMGKSFYSGLDVDVSSLYRGDVTDEEFEAELKALLLSNRKEIALGQKNAVIGYGDDVAYYVIGVKDEAGNAVLTGDFAASSYTSSAMTVGKEAFGKDFDEKLIAMGLKPADTALETRTNGTLAGDEVVIITLYAYKSKSVKDAANADLTKKYEWNTGADKQIERARFLLSDQKEALREALKGVTVGEDVTFVLENYKLTDDSTPASAAVKFDVRVHAVVTEKTQDISFTVPEDYFEKTDSQDLSVYNGKTLTFSMIFSYVNDYEVPALDADFVTNTMKFETDEADVVAAFKAAKRAEMNEQIRESLEAEYVQQILYLLSQKANFLTVDMPMEAMNEEYYAYVEYFRQVIGRSPEDDELDAFAQQYLGAQGYYNVLTANVKGNLLVFYIFRHAGLKISDEEMEEAYREYVDGLIDAAGDPELYDEDHFVLLYTREGLYRNARTELVQEMVGDYLLSHNNLITEKSK